MQRVDRKWARVTRAAVTGILVSASGAFAASHVETKPQAKPADLVARGEYLATITGCGDCHTPGTFYGAPDMSRKLSGSELGWQGPWGVSYARNLTPDKETGIGSWTDEQIITAIRQGRRPDGTPVLPPMPWPDFAAMTDDDVKAIVAFLRSVPPVHHAVPAVVPPGKPATGAYLTFPPPPAWDAPRTPPATK